MEVSSRVDTERDPRSLQERRVRAQVKVGSCGIPYLVFVGGHRNISAHSSRPMVSTESPSCECVWNRFIATSADM